MKILAQTFRHKCHYRAVIVDDAFEVVVLESKRQIFDESSTIRSQLNALHRRYALTGC